MFNQLSKLIVVLTGACAVTVLVVTVLSYSVRSEPGPATKTEYEDWVRFGPVDLPCGYFPDEEMKQKLKPLGRCEVDTDCAVIPLPHNRTTWTLAVINKKNMDAGFQLVEEWRERNWQCEPGAGFRKFPARSREPQAWCPAGQCKVGFRASDH